MCGGGGGGGAGGAGISHFTLIFQPTVDILRMGGIRGEGL